MIRCSLDFLHQVHISQAMRLVVEVRVAGLVEVVLRIVRVVGVRHPHEVRMPSGSKVYDSGKGAPGSRV